MLQRLRRPQGTNRIYCSMIITILYILFAALAVIDLLSAASVRREAEMLSQLLYAQAVEKPHAFLISAKIPEVLREYVLMSGVLEQEADNVVRMRRKGALRLHERGAWQPFEGKFFLSGTIPGMVAFAEVTTGIFCSRSILRTISAEGFKWLEKRWGLGFRPLFSDKEDIRTYLLMEYFAAGVWCPYVWLQSGLQWEEKRSSEIVVQAGPTLSLTLQFSGDGLPQSLSASIGERVITYTYSGYQHLAGVLVPLHWTVDISRPGTRYTYINGQVTDIVFGGNFAWW